MGERGSAWGRLGEQCEQSSLEKRQKAEPSLAGLLGRETVVRTLRSWGAQCGSGTEWK